MEPKSRGSVATTSPLEAAARAVALLRSRLAANVEQGPGGVEHEDIFRTEGTISTSDTNLDGMDAAVDAEGGDAADEEAADASRRSVQAAIEVISNLDDRLAELERKEADIAIERARHRAIESARMRELEVRKEQVRMARWIRGMQASHLTGDDEHGDGDGPQSLAGSAAAGAAPLTGTSCNSIAQIAVTRGTRVSARQHASAAQKGRYIRYDDAASTSTAKPVVRKDLYPQPHLQPAGLPIKLRVPRPPLPASQLNHQALHSNTATPSSRITVTAVRKESKVENLDIWSHCSDDDRDGEDAQLRQRTQK